MESSDDEEEKSNICQMENHQDGEVTSHFSYHDLLRIWRKNEQQTNKLDSWLNNHGYASMKFCHKRAFECFSYIHDCWCSLWWNCDGNYMEHDEYKFYIMWWLW